MESGQNRIPVQSSKLRPVLGFFVSGMCIVPFWGSTLPDCCPLFSGFAYLWQVNGRHEISFEHWMELDLQYIDNWSLELDLEILMKSIPVFLRGSGAS